MLTVGVVTKPFDFEGARRMRQAEAGIEALQKVVDTLIVIPNQNLFRLASMTTSIREAFMMADDVLYLGVRGVTDLMIKPGLMNLDFADVRSVMEEMGKAMMGTGEATTEEFPEGRAKAAAQAAIANPLLDEVSLSSAKGVLINVMGGLDMTLFDLDEATNTIKSCVDSDANILVGSALDEEMEGRIRVSVVATGIDAEEMEGAQPAVHRPIGERPQRPARRESDAPERETSLQAAFAEAPAPFEHAPPQPRGGLRDDRDRSEAEGRRRPAPPGLRAPARVPAEGRGRAAPRRAPGILCRCAPQGRARELRRAPRSRRGARTSCGRAARTARRRRAAAVRPVREPRRARAAGVQQPGRAHDRPSRGTGPRSAIRDEAPSLRRGRASGRGFPRGRGRAEPDLGPGVPASASQLTTPPFRGIEATVGLA